MIKLAVVGAGHWGPNLINNLYTHKDAWISWVADANPSRLATVAERFPGVQTTDDAAAAIGAEDTDAVLIATPTNTHYLFAKQALEAGKHVLVEKPLAATVEEAEALCKLAAEVGRILMVGHIFVYNEASRKAKEYISEGDLGRVYYISMERTNLGPIRVDVNAAWDLAAHDISLASYWLNADPITASAVGGAWINRGVEDAVFATLRYPGDVLVHLHASWLNPKKSRGITVVGERRMLTFDDINMNEPIRVYDKKVRDERTDVPFVDTFASYRMSVRDGDIVIPKVQMGEPLKAEINHFLECIENNSRPLSAGPEGLAVVKTLDAITRSLAEGGREVQV
ncbi:MAG: gfo/Idh/MocA family oxidoreductase [Acidobacteria bacterium]|nr:gfo/Idh/MocA family oxidoreductase [Acidobacteriota bacterium]